VHGDESLRVLALHHVNTLDAKLAEQANRPISRRETTLVHTRNPSPRTDGTVPGNQPCDGAFGFGAL
jgi:hypothetical protein